MSGAISSAAAVLVQGHSLSIAEVVRVAKGACQVSLSPTCLEPVAASRQVIERISEEGRVVYGVTTGFGALKDRRIPPQATAELQLNLLRSHAAGVGPVFPVPVVRAMLLLRANALARGASGVRPEVIEQLISFLNRGLTPVIPCQGSVGASGDLAPLAHMALALLGEGEVEMDGNRLPASQALERQGLKPLTLGAKEGLALINGTQAMTALGCLILADAEQLAKIADIACSLTLDAVMGSNRPFQADFQALRPHLGQLSSARNLSRLSADSEIIASHADCDRVQDCYSLRCAPQVHGASRDALAHVRRVLEVEINSATDNPLVLPDSQEVLTGGHFHGQPVALALDFMKIAIAELANISERRIERLVNAQYSNGLPAFLATDGGLNSGYMLAQYSAAALVSENKALSHPASVDSIPTGAGQEDHVSMGTHGARLTWQVLGNAQQVLAIELLCGAQGVDFRQPLQAGLGARAARDAVRSGIPILVGDRVVAKDFAVALELLRAGTILEFVEGAVGPLE